MELREQLLKKSGYMYNMWLVEEVGARLAPPPFFGGGRWDLIVVERHFCVCRTKMYPAS